LLHIANSRADRSTPVGIHKLDSRLRYLAVLDNATAQFVGDVHGYVSAPTFSGIEGDDADRAVEPALHQITDQRLPVSGAFIGLPPRFAETAKIIQHKVSVLLRPMGAQ
jgi:hypothetical protein